MAVLRRKFKANAIRSILLEASLADFTDGGGTTGTYDATTKVPVGSTIFGVKIVGGDFSGDTTAGVDVGNTAGTSWLRVSQVGYAAAFPVTTYSLPANEASGEVFAAAAATPRISIIGNASFASIVADANAKAKARIYVEIYYLDLNAKSL